MNKQMDEQYKEYWRKNRTLFVENIRDTPKVLDYLYEADIFTRSMVEQCLTRPGTTSQNRELLDIIIKRGPRAVMVFSETLVKNNQGELVTQSMTNKMKTKPTEQYGKESEEWQMELAKALVVNIKPIPEIEEDSSNSGDGGADTSSSSNTTSYFLWRDM